MVEVMLPDMAIQRVLEGHPIVYPTTTLPALGCLPEAEALDRLFELKKRSGTKVVSLGVCDIHQASTLVQIPEVATQILRDFPEGSLTLILPAVETLDERLGGDWVAVRVLADARARELVSRTGPLTATSANISGEDPVTDCEQAAAILQLPSQDFIPGQCVGGAPSTLIRWNNSGSASQDSDWTVIREGKVSAGEIHEWSMQRT